MEIKFNAFFVLSAVFHTYTAAILADIRRSYDQFYRNPCLNGLHMGDDADTSSRILDPFQAGHDHIQKFFIQIAEAFIQEEQFQRCGSVQLDRGRQCQRQGEGSDKGLSAG